MNKMLWRLAALPLALGCAAEDNRDGADGSVASELARAEQEVQHHHQVVMNASDVARVAAETTVHDERMRGILGDMYDSVSYDMHCSHDGKDQMHSMTTSMEQAQGEHMGGVHGGRSLEALQAACTAYVAQMHTLLEDMHHALVGASCMH
jgi:hypothetical protein